MTVWIAIEHAPKDRPVDLWGGTKSNPSQRRFTDCLRSQVLGGWYSPDEDHRIEPTHYMEIPAGPATMGEEQKP